MKIFVSRQLPGGDFSQFEEKGIEVFISNLGRPLSQEELIESSEGVDILVTLLTDKIDGDVMDAIGPNLKMIANYAVGFDNINLDEASKRGIVVCNTPSHLVNEAVAEHTLALIFSLARRIVEADEATRRGAYRGWEPDIFLGELLKNKTLGIVGLGRIGKMVAQKAKALEMRVIYNKRTRDVDAEAELGIEYKDLDQLLKSSDFISLHVPLTDETFHLIDDEGFRKVKRGAFLINTARGAVVDEDALVKVLKEGRLKGAALDVFENEPNINPELIGMENVILTPHIASATKEARKDMFEKIKRAIEDYLEGRKPENIVNGEIWDLRRK